jgi:hypothetical protein
MMTALSIGEQGSQDRGSGVKLRRLVRHSFSKPAVVNFSVRAFSVTARTTFSEAPDGISASISRVAFTFAPTIAVSWEMTVPAGAQGG